MPVIYYSYYTPVSRSITAVSAQEHALGRKLLLLGLQDLYRLEPPMEGDVPLLDAGPGGKPVLAGHPDICFNISHCDGLAACAFHDRPIGVDAELPGYFPEILIRRALSEQEKGFLQAAGDTPARRQEWFYRLWTLKEAYVKKSGIGVDTDLTSFSFSFSNTGDTKDPHAVCSDPGVSCYQVKLAHGQILSLCYEGGQEQPLLIEQSLG